MIKTVSLAATLGLAVLGLCVLATPATAQAFTGSTYLEKLGETGDFFVSLQIRNPTDANYGGIKSDENSPDGYQSDVGQAIWHWSTLKQLTGTTDYDDAIALAWIYQNGIDPNTRSVFYQQTYDSAWFLLGELAYRQATGDNTFVSLAHAHGDWLVNNRLDWGIQRNIITDGFAAGALYQWAVDQNDAALRAGALQTGDDCRQEIEADTSILQLRSIEIAGAAGFIGVLNSVFTEDFESRKAWIETYGPFLPNTAPPPGGFQYSYQGYIAGAHELNWEFTADPAWKSIQMALVPPLIAEDDDDDGGIPRNDHLTYDDAWVSSNLGHFNFYQMIPDLDLALSPDNWQVVPPGSFDFDFSAANHTDSTQVFYLVAFLKVPTGASLLLTVRPITLPGGFVLSLSNISFPFDVGSLTGTYELMIQSYSSSAKLQDTAVAQFEVL